MDERARGGVVREAEAVAGEVPSRNLPPVTYREMPEALVSK